VLAVPVVLGGADRVDGAGAVVVVDGGLSPKVLTVSTGTTVTWNFADADKHRIRSRSGPVEFDSGGIDSGGSYSFSFTRTGSYSYRDEENKDLEAYNGSIVVVAPSDPATTTSNLPVPTTIGATTLPPGGTPPTVPPTVSPTVPPPPSGPTTVRIANRAFSPSSISVATGATVVWTNNDSDPHTVTASAGGFDSGRFSPGASYRHTFNTAGRFSYFCDLHPSMVGVVVVTSPPPGGTLPPPPPPPAPPATTVPATTIPAGDGGSNPPVGSNGVRMVDFGFEPPTLTIDADTTVTWVNTGQARHTVAADDGSFHSPDVRAGATFQQAFSVPGTYTYFCDIHPEMKGTISVRGAAGEPPPPAPPTTALPPVTASGDVRIADFSFSPRSITITVGDSLTFVNTGAARHSATARDGSFDTGLLNRGVTSRRTFRTAGTFAYFCTIHPSMTGTVLVTGANGEAPPPAVSRPTDPVAVGDVAMIDFAFTPSEQTVPLGTSVGFVNNGVAPHTATARDGSFDTDIVRSGKTQRVTFANPGTFAFYCTIHPDMTGTIFVSDSAGVVPPAATEVEPGTAPPMAVEVEVLAETFSPADVRVAQGGTITWRVSSISPHIIEADDNSFVSEIITHSKTYQHTFESAGSFSYHDGLTGRMKGSVTVVADPLTAESGVADDGLSASVRIIDLAYEPPRVTVVKGATVNWSNVGQAPHTVTARSDNWTSDLLQPGVAYSQTFTTPGNYDYYCTLHPNMVASVVVLESLGDAAPELEQQVSPGGDAPSGADGPRGLLPASIAAGLILCAGTFLLGRRTRRVTTA
jgi:plastocyanin